MSSGVLCILPAMIAPLRNFSNGGTGRIGRKPSTFFQYVKNNLFPKPDFIAPSSPITTNCPVAETPVTMPCGNIFFIY
jgi:hypothetical protein